MLCALLGLVPADGAFTGFSDPAVITVAAGLIAHRVLALSGDAGPFLLLAVTLVATMAITPVLNNAATVIIMAPIALGVARDLGAWPKRSAGGLYSALRLAALPLPAVHAKFSRPAIITFSGRDLSGGGLMYRTFGKGGRTALVGLMALLASACATEDHGRNETAGTLIGAAGGGLLGAAVGGRGSGGAAAVAFGTFAGAALGNAIGRKLDEADRLAMMHAHQQALETAPSGTAVAWHNPDSGHGGSVTPQPAFRNGEGQYCREYTQMVTVGGKPVEGYGTACRQPDGSWRIVN